MLVNRSAYTGDAAAGHSTNAWERSSAVLFRFLHLWHHRRTVVGRAAAQSLLSGSSVKRLRRWVRPLTTPHAAPINSTALKKTLVYDRY